MPLFVVAFHGEHDRLTATLGALRPLDRPVTILGSDDAGLAACAATFSAGFIAGLPRQCPEHDYWCRVLAALPEDTGVCLVLRAGSRVPGYWTQRLLPALAERVAAVFPLAVRHPCTTVFTDPRHRPGLDVQLVDNWLNRYVPGRDYDVPLFCGWSALVNRQLIPSGICNSDPVLAEALRLAGRLLLVSDNLYVDDSAFAAQLLPESCYPGWQDAIVQRHHLGGLRHALTELSQRQEAPPANLRQTRPVRLHVSHGWGGGLWRWVEDFVVADSACRNLVLRPIGDRTAFAQTLALYDSTDGRPLASWTLVQPILSTAIAQYEYAQLLQHIIADYGVTQIMVSSLIGHSLDLLATGLPTVVVCHDFYPLCPPILATWDTPCSHCDDARMEACLAHNPGHRFFEFEPLAHWLTLRSKYLDAVMADNIALVAPSRSVVARMHALAPGLRDKVFHVVPHGLPEELLNALAHAKDAGRRSGARLRILVLGSLEPHKGGGLLRAVVKQLTGFADLLLLGVGDGGGMFANLAGVTVVPQYERDRLGHLLAEYGPDLGVLLSTVPETFSYTLSELHAAGIPVAATDLGAFADRIEPDVDGWLLAPNGEALLSLLRHLHREPERIDAVRRTLVARPGRHAAIMVADYDRIVCGFPGEMALLRPRSERASDPQSAVHGLLYVRPDASFREAVQGFTAYTETKIRSSRRIPRIFKRVLAALVRWLA